MAAFTMRSSTLRGGDTLRLASIVTLAVTVSDALAPNGMSLLISETLPMGTALASDVQGPMNATATDAVDN